MEQNEVKDKDQLVHELMEAHKRIEELESQSSDLHRYKSIVEQSPSVVVMSDLESNINYVNPRFLELTGYSNEEALEMNTADLGVQPSEERTEMHKTVTSGHAWRGEYHNKKKNGEDYWVVASNTAIRNSDGVITHFLSIQEDITERKKINLALQESEERFRTLTERMPDGVSVITLDRRFLYANPALLELSGYSMEELQALPSVLDLVHPDDHKLVLERGEAMERREPEEIAESRMITKDGRTIPVETTSRRISYNGEPALLGVIHSIAERKRLQEALLKKRETESVATLAGGIAREFNNLLMTILGQASLAKEKLPKKSSAQNHISRTLTAAERASDLIRQLLAYSGLGHFEIKPVHLNTLINDNLHLYKLAIRDTIELEFDLVESLPTIIADAGQVQQVVMNLVVNAVDAIADQPGTVTIVTSERNISPDDEPVLQYDGEPLKPGRYVSVEVRDGARGIPAHLIPRIFEPFFTTKTSDRRPGLGLAALLGIVKSYNGGVQIESESGKGTTVRVFFSAEAVDAIQKPDASAVAHKRDLVLVIDHEKSVHADIAKMLSPIGLRIVSAMEGNMGIRLYQKHALEIGLVLLDWAMPDLSSKVILHELKAVNPNVRLVLTSGFAEAEAERRFGSEGLLGFIQKPYQTEKFTQEITEYLNAP